MSATVGLVLAAFGTGVALAGSPGPVQVVIVGETAVGGVRRGFHALAGASVTFGALLAMLVLGVSVVAPQGLALHVLEAAGGAALVWMAWHGRRTDLGRTRAGSLVSLPPGLRGALSVLANPGAWLFLGAVAAPLLAAATDRGGRTAALVVAGALTAGAATGDSLIVAAGGLGFPRLGEHHRQRVVLALVLILTGIGVWLLIRGIGGVTGG